MNSNLLLNKYLDHKFGERNNIIFLISVNFDKLLGSSRESELFINTLKKDDMITVLDNKEILIFTIREYLIDSINSIKGSISKEYYITKITTDKILNRLEKSNINIGYSKEALSELILNGFNKIKNLIELVLLENDCTLENSYITDYSHNEDLRVDTDLVVKCFLN